MTQGGGQSASGTGHQAQATWIWDATHQLYYSPESGMYAYTDHTTGQWHYIPASSFASTSATETARRPDQGGEREEGEIEDDVGWGGLMEPEELDRALKAKVPGSVSVAASAYRGGATRAAPVAEKHPAYGGGSSSSINTAARPVRSPTPPPTKERPNHLLRLVVLSSPSLTEGQVAVIDTREGGIQLGRDRCEKGGHPRVRVREMEVSKSHAVVYWGQGEVEGEEDGWFVVDLGSTHGTSVTPPPQIANDPDGEPLPLAAPIKPKRLSEPKVSSLPHTLTHLSMLSLGKTRFEVHLHPSWPCEQCQLSGKGNEIPIDTGDLVVPGADTATDPEQVTGNNGYAMNSSEKRGNREMNRKREMAALKDSLLNRNVQKAARDDQQQQQQNRYIDRSAIRRQMHPRPRSPPTPSSRPAPAHEQVDRTPAGVSAFAQNMLAAQGWAPGTGLGRDQGGRSEAIEVRMRVEKRGLGASGGEAPAPTSASQADGVDEDWRKRAKMRRFEEMR